MNKKVTNNIMREINSYYDEYLNIKNKAQAQITIEDRYAFADTILKEEFENTKEDLSQIYKKVVLLNSLYSTNIYATFEVTLKISKIHNFRKRVMSGDLLLVDEIRKNIISGKNKDFYSFATKYCHHHNANAYPIYDSFVENSLMVFSKELFPNKIQRSKMKDYHYFKGNIDSLANKWQLPEDFKYTKIDKYLWKKGKESENRNTEPVNAPKHPSY